MMAAARPVWPMLWIAAALAVGACEGGASRMPFSSGVGVNISPPGGTAGPVDVRSQGRPDAIALPERPRRVAYPDMPNPL